MDDVDLTASMKGKGPGGTRFEAARREFLSLVDGLSPERRMMLIGAASETRLVVPFTADKTRLREAGRKLLATDAAGDVKNAVLFAHAFLKKGSRDRVVVISDGAYTGAGEFSRESAHLRLIEIPGGTENVGIVPAIFYRLAVIQRAPSCRRLVVAAKTVGVCGMTRNIVDIAAIVVLVADHSHGERVVNQRNVEHQRAPVTGIALAAAPQFAVENRLELVQYRLVGDDAVGGDRDAAAGRRPEGAPARHHAGVRSVNTPIRAAPRPAEA